MMKKLHIFADFGKFIKEFFLFLKRRKRWWLLPLVLLITVLMYCGRIGPLTLALALARASTRQYFSYPEARVLIG